MTNQPEDPVASFDDMVNSLVDGESTAVAQGAGEIVMAEETPAEEPSPEVTPEVTPEEPIKKTRGHKKAERASGLVITDELPESTRLEMAAGRAALLAKLAT